VPGILQSLIADAPPHSRIVRGGGMHAHRQHRSRSWAVTKEMELRFSFGYTPDEFRGHAGRVWPRVWPGADLLVTSTV